MLLTTKILVTTNRIQISILGKKWAYDSSNFKILQLNKSENEIKREWIKGDMFVNVYDYWVVKLYNSCGLIKNACLAQWHLPVVAATQEA